MNKNQTEALLSCIRNNAIDTLELYDYLNTVHPGDFHFTNGTHFPVLLPGLTADGVFVSEDYYLTANERVNGKTTKSRAQRFCRNRGCVLPDWTAKRAMIEHRDEINASLEILGFPLLAEGEYWAEDDSAGEGEPGEIIFGGPAPGDDTYIGGSWTNYHKYVRGCIKVTKTSQKLDYTESEFEDEQTTVLDSIFKDFGISRYQFMMYHNNKNCYPQPGHYLLKNGAHSVSTVYDQEAGIFANANLYIKLDMPKSPFTSEQAMVYLKAYEAQVPEYFALRQIAKAAPEINKALTAVGMKDFLLPENVLEGCWCKESLDKAFQNDEEGSTEEKRVLLVGNQPNVNDKYLIIEDIWEHISLDY